MLNARVEDYMPIVEQNTMDSGFFLLIDYDLAPGNPDWVAGTERLH